MWRAALGSILVAGSVASSLSGPPTFHATLPREDWIPPVPAELIDLSGLVEGFVAVSPGRLSWDAGVSVAGDDLRVAWNGGACEAKVRLVLRPTEDGYAVDIDNDRTLLGLVGCAAVAVPRVVRIDLTQSIQGRPIRLTVETD